MTFKEDLRRPFNIFTTLLAIVSILAGAFFYYKSNKTKSLSYQINEPSSLIYDSKNASSAIKVLEKDSIPIKDNVYILTGIVWNSGDIPISHEDVRQTINLNLGSAKRILDFRIIKQTDPLIANFRLTKLNDQSLILQWKYFDPNYAFKFQIIYTGYENPQFNLSGKVLDIKDFKKVSTPIKGDMTRYIAIVGMLASIFIALMEAFSLKNRQKGYSIFWGIMAVFIIVFLIYGLLFTNDPVPLFN